MTGVLLAAAKTDKKMWKTFPCILNETLGAVYLQNGEWKQRSAGDEILVCDIAYFDLIRPDNAILIWKDGGAIPSTLIHSEQVVAVVDADADPQTLQQLRDTSISAITCGMSTHDTLTLSSYGSENTLITLQRSLNCFDSTVVEPQEIPIALRGPIDSFTLMSIAAVFLLTGNQKALHEALFDVDPFK